ncbi:hypothetical protein CF326_g7338 [Tilletia indica]|nr:hypothetical protein CF326_g7338 [Tilletia indica]
MNPPSSGMGSRAAASPALFNSDFKLPYIGGDRSPSAAGSPSTSLLSWYGFIRSIASTESRALVLRKESIIKHRTTPWSSSAEGRTAQTLQKHAENIIWRIEDPGRPMKVQEDGHSPPQALRLAIDRAGTLPYAAAELLCGRLHASTLSPTAKSESTLSPTAKSESVFHDDDDNSPSPSHKDSAQSIASPYASDIWLGVLSSTPFSPVGCPPSTVSSRGYRLTKAEREMPSRLRRAPERRAAALAAEASSITAIGGGISSQPRDLSDSSVSAWSLRAPRSPQGLGRTSSLSRAGRAGGPFGSSTSSSMFRGSSPLGETVLLDLQEFSASMPALSPPLGMRMEMRTTTESDAL